MRYSKAMYPDLPHLRTWYRSPLGLVVQGLLLRQLVKCWPDLKGQKVLLLGYGLPWGEAWPEADVFAAMPAQMGAEPWPEEKENRLCMVWEGDLPFVDQQFDRILLVHTVEFTEHPKALLQECWRCLKPDGRVLAVLPNRTGAWCQREVSPFARGHPYSSGQLNRLLNRCHFHVLSTRFAVFMPPSTWPFFLKMAGTLERLGQLFFSVFGGVVLVEGRKDQLGGQLVQATEKPLGKRVLKPAGAFMKKSS